VIEHTSRILHVLSWSNLQSAAAWSRRQGEKKNRSAVEWHKVQRHSCVAANRAWSWGGVARAWRSRVLFTAFLNVSDPWVASRSESAPRQLPLPLTSQPIKRFVAPPLPHFKEIMYLSFTAFLIVSDPLGGARRRPGSGLPPSVGSRRLALLDMQATPRSVPQVATMTCNP
jgi:hypothetical protein